MDYIANTIVQQMGGEIRFKLFLGKVDFAQSERGVIISFSNQAPRPNRVKITLNFSDLYDLEFSTVNKNSEKVVKTIKNIYYDQLVEIFERETGLYLYF